MLDERHHSASIIPPLDLTAYTANDPSKRRRRLFDALSCGGPRSSGWGDDLAVLEDGKVDVAAHRFDIPFIAPSS